MSRVDKQGRVTLPANVRRAMHLNTGDIVVFVKLRYGTWLLRKKQRRPILAHAWENLGN